MTLSSESTSDLRKELRRREEADQAEAWRVLNDRHGPCPECGGPLREVESKVVLEHYSAPDWQGWPVPPPENWPGKQVDGVEIDTRLVCVNGHERWADRQIKWYGDRDRRER